MKVVLVQTNPGEDKAANLAEVEHLIDTAVAVERPDLLALPELFACMSDSLEVRQAAAEVLPGGAAYSLLSRAAARHGVAIHGGSLLERDGETYFNTTVVFGRDGRELARYRKIHLFDMVLPDGRPLRESATVGRGTEVVCYPFEGRRIGCTICYDLRFPELFQRLARLGADVILVPSVFTADTGKDHWSVLLRARAIETQAYVLAPAQCGSYAGGRRRNHGRSLAVDPWGTVIAQASDGAGFIAARLDFDVLAKVRQRLPMLPNKVLE